MRRVHDVVREARLQHRPRQRYQLSSLDVRRGDVPARQRHAQATDSGEHRIGGVRERMRGRQIGATHLGCAKPVGPALQAEIRDQRQPRNVRRLRDLPDAWQRRRRDGEQRIVHQVVRRQPRPRSRPVTDAEVRPGIVEARQRDRRFEIQVHLRMRGGEARQARNQPAVGQRMQSGDPNARDLLVAASAASRRSHRDPPARRWSRQPARDPAQ